MEQFKNLSQAIPYLESIGLKYNSNRERYYYLEYINSSFVGRTDFYRCEYDVRILNLANVIRSHYGILSEHRIHSIEDAKNAMSSLGYEFEREEDGCFVFENENDYDKKISFDDDADFYENEERGEGVRLGIVALVNLIAKKHLPEQINNTRNNLSIQGNSNIPNGDGRLTLIKVVNPRTPRELLAYYFPREIMEAVMANSKNYRSLYRNDDFFDKTFEEIEGMSDSGASEYKLAIEKFRNDYHESAINEMIGNFSWSDTPEYNRHSGNVWADISNSYYIINNTSDRLSDLDFFIERMNCIEPFEYDVLNDRFLCGEYLYLKDIKLHEYSNDAKKKTEVGFILVNNTDIDIFGGLITQKIIEQRKREKEEYLKNKVQIDIDTWKFGFEPTFMPKYIPEPIRTNDRRSALDEYMEYMADNIVNHSSDLFTSEQRKVVERFYKDSNSLEVPTNVYSDFTEYMNDYKVLVKQLNALNFQESSNTDMWTEGGCHINFDLAFMTSDIRIKVFKNLVQYINLNPSIVWLFLAPNDNRSSCVVDEPSSKGHFCIKHSNRLELRFFMMPRSIREFELHYRFAKKLMAFIYKRTCAGKNIDSIYRGVKFDCVTYEKSLEIIQSVCKDIGFNYREIERSGKLELLQERYDNGTEYLN